MTMDVHKALDGAFAGIMRPNHGKKELAILEQLAFLAGQDMEQRYILTDCPARNYKRITAPVSITPIVKRTQLEDN